MPKYSVEKKYCGKNRQKDRDWHLKSTLASNIILISKESYFKINLSDRFLLHDSNDINYM